MIQLDLAKEQEQALYKQAAARGLTPDAYATELLSEQEAFSAFAPDEETRRRQAEAGKRIAQRRLRPDAPRLDLPEDVSIREWLHQGHRF